MGQPFEAGAISIAVILVASLVQFFLPIAPRYDTVSTLLGFESRHPVALVSEVSASVFATLLGLFCYFGIRSVFARLGITA